MNTNENPLPNIDSVFLSLLQQHRIVRDAILGIAEQIAEKTAIIPLLGRP